MNEGSGYLHQDWNEVILHKPVQVKSSSHNNNPGKTPDQKLDEITEAKPLPKSSQELRISLQKARMAKKLNQKQLAGLLGLTAPQIAKYENGKEVPSNQMLAKMEKILGVKLPRVKK
tara:strand:- start:225 stop:575 length:351 start_codon:yes stop_codon:yes gene_type:complete